MAHGHNDTALSEYANEEIDILKTISMLLIHDIVEIDAGDTYAYDQEEIKTQRERETKAADRIFGLLPEDQKVKFRMLWEEFENNEHQKPILLIQWIIFNQC